MKKKTNFLLNIKIVGKNINIKISFSLKRYKLYVQGLKKMAKVLTITISNL